MNFLFIIQGEGRGHFTQALVMGEMLRQQGDQVVGVLVGKSSARCIPTYFSRRIQADVVTFESPNFLPTPQNRRPELMKSIFYNICHLGVFYKSMCFIREKINELQPDIVLNFYELMTGFTYLFMPPEVPQVCIGHQYMFLHPEFEFPRHVSGIQLLFLRFFTRMTCLYAKKRLALSFYPLHEEKEMQLVVVPPLIRPEVKRCVPEKGDYILGYLLNSGYQPEVEEWHRKHPEMILHFFWDKKGVPACYSINPHFILHQIDDALFVEYMSECMAYATTAGFESVCEALYLHKPILMIPAHVEQECNAFDACRVGAGRVAESFDMDQLLEGMNNYQPDVDFGQWADCAGQKIYTELQAVYQEQRDRERGMIYSRWRKSLRSVTSKLQEIEMSFRS